MPTGCAVWLGAGFGAQLFVVLAGLLPGRVDRRTFYLVSTGCMAAPFGLSAAAGTWWCALPGVLTALWFEAYARPPRPARAARHGRTPGAAPHRARPALRSPARTARG